MRTSTSPFPGRTTAGPAVAVSVALHGLLVLAFYLAAGADPGGPPRAPAPLDTRVPTFTVRAVAATRPAAAAASPVPAPEPILPVVPTVSLGRRDGPTALATLSGGPARTPGPGAGLGLEKGGGGGTTFFEIGTQARAVVYVVDRSSSMGPSGALAAAKREVLASLDRLPESARFQVIAYNRHAEPLRLAGRSALADATPGNKREAAARLDDLPAEGGTDHLKALHQALALHPDAIFFLTDADDLTLDQIRAVTRANHGRAAIHAVRLGRRPSDSALAALARGNRGEFRAVPVSAAPPR